MLDASKMLGTSFLGPFFTFSFHAFNMSFSRALTRNRFATQLDFSIIIIIIIIAVTLRGGGVILPGYGMRAKHGLPLWQRQHTFRGRAANKPSRATGHFVALFRFIEIPPKANTRPLDGWCSAVSAWSGAGHPI